MASEFQESGGDGRSGMRDRGTENSPEVDEPVSYETVTQNDRPSSRSISVKAGLLTLAIGVAGVISCVATFSHAEPRLAELAFMAFAFSVAATVPAYWFSQAIINGAVKQLAIVLWRIGWLLPPLWFMTRLEGSAKSVFIMVLLACYFVGLTVESAMLISDARRQS